ncbi:hypothetical protein NDU88_000901 [Pleurodeles waltl]|uniref:Uncharacterized protein n=1 Tax=Pleurodeles waltl TaxID=8319 RepID=A0AAV7U6U1_PLEWA|nr:hypothetical protein NDU88_000901 [Pleurodeles waltl]
MIAAGAHLYKQLRPTYSSRAWSRMGGVAAGKDSAGAAPQNIAPRVRSSGKVSGLFTFQLQPARAFAPGQQASGKAPTERAGPETGAGLGRTNSR